MEAYKVHFKPWSYNGYNFIPEWEKFNQVKLNSGVNIFIDPGMAFGTGTHETTRLCIELLIDNLDQKSDGRYSMLDVGCGSGILSILGQHIGFKSIHGIDNDENAIQNSLHNLSLNFHESTIKFEQKSIDSFENDSYDCIVANIQSDVLIKNAQRLVELLKNNGITATITGREKTPFSIWRKIQNKKISLEQLTDIIGFRVIVKSVEECYKTLGIFHSRFSTIPGKFKDYISTPKINNYKSIHTAVVGPKKNRIEIQIRTHEMHEFAQRGIASHWKYKSSEKFSELSWKEYDWLRDLVEIIEAGTSPEHYYEFTKLQMFQENVFCFTPKGAVIKLPKNATPIDFAYAVHTKIGNSAIGCTVNGRSSTLQTILKNGDLVSIETSKNASPSLHWLSSSATGKARSAIRRYWQDKSTESLKTQEKNYSSTIEVDLPHKPGVLGHITSLIGLNKGNIVNLEIIKRNKEHLTFSFDLQIKDLKNFTNLISQIKQSNLNFKIIRHKQKKNALLQRILKNFKRD